METWVLASGNAHKTAEFNRFFENAGLPVRLVTMREAGFDGDIDESGLSFAENAFRKADAVWKSVGGTVLADDSGLCVDALGGRPGIYSARYAGAHGDDEKNNDKLLKELEDVPDEERTARFMCALCVIFEDGKNCVTEGAAEGRILRERRGKGGFGYDPLFWYPPAEKAFAELTPEEKEAVSHRGIALRKLVNALRDRFPETEETKPKKHHFALRLRDINSEKGEQET